MERSKRNGRKKNNKQLASTAIVVDECHSLDTPCCNQIVQITNDVFPEAKTVKEGVLNVPSASTTVTATATTAKNGDSSTTATATAATSSLFGILVRKHLLEERSKVVAAAAASPTKRKNRKKRKKKKNGKANTATTSTDGEGVTANEAPATSESINGSSSPQHQEVGTSSSSAASSSAPVAPEQNDATATTTVAALTPPTPPNSSPSTSNDKPADKTDTIVLQWLDRLQPSPPPESDSKELQPLPLHHNRSLAAFCQTLLASTTSTSNDSNESKPNAPRLSIAAISAALRATKCVACRSAAETYWQSTGMPMVDLGLVGGAHYAKECVVLETSMVSMNSKDKNGGLVSIPVAGHDEWGRAGTSMDRAFDYQAMEEGTMTASTEKTSEDRIIVLEPVADKEGTIESMQVTTELDTTAIERLVRQMILPCGLVELQDANAVRLSDAEFDAIVSHVELQQKRIWGQLQELQEKKARVQKLFHVATELVHPATAYDVKGASALQDCDTECDQLLNALVNMLLQMTTLTDGLPSAQWAHMRTGKLWQHYERGVQRILRMSLQHEAKLLQLANRPGVVPQLFMNASHRASLRDLVQEKCNVLSGIYTEFFSSLCTDDYNMQAQPTFFRRLLTCQPFTAQAAAVERNKIQKEQQQALAEKNAKNKNGKSKNGTTTTVPPPPVSSNTLERTQLDTVITRLVEAFSKFIYSVRSGHVTEIHNTQEVKCKQLSELLRESTTMITEEYEAFLKQRAMQDEKGTAAGAATIDQTQWKELRKEGTDLISQYSTYQSSRTSTESENVTTLNGDPPPQDETFIADFTMDGHNSEALADMRQDLVKLVVNMISQWRCLRWMRSQTLDASIMPLRLIQWMNRPDLVVAVGRDGSANNAHKNVCQGGGGKRRLGSVLSSLIYQWLVDRCNEWHAELTQSELLATMEELTGVSSMKESPSKAAKKRKKKKAQAAMEEIPIKQDETVAESLPEPSKPASSTMAKTKPIATDADAMNGAHHEEEKKELVVMNGGHKNRFPDEPGVEESKEEPSLVEETKIAAKAPQEAKPTKAERRRNSKERQSKEGGKKVDAVNNSNKKQEPKEGGKKSRNQQKRENAAAAKDAAANKESTDFTKKGQQQQPKSHQGGRKNRQSKDVAGKQDLDPTESQPPKDGGKSNKNHQQSTKDAAKGDPGKQQQPQTKEGSRKKKRNQHKGDKENGSHHKNKKSKNNNNKAEEHIDEEETEKFIPLMLGVEDLSGEVEAVEDFLVSRLLDILKVEGAMDGGKPIVFL